MKKYVFCAVVLSMLLAFTGCQKQSVGEAPAASTRRPVVSEQTTSQNEDITLQDENSVSSKPLIPDDVSVVARLDTSNPLGQSGESSEESSEVSSQTKKSPDKITSDEVASNGTYTFAGVTIDLPEGYHTMSAAENVAIIEPGEKTSGIYLTVTFMDIGSSYKFTRENIEELKGDVYDDFSGLTEYKEYQIDGCDAQYYTFDYNSSDKRWYYGTLMVFFVDREVEIDFTSTDKEALENVLKSVDTVRIE